MPKYSRKIEIAGKSAQEIYEKISSDIDRVLGKVPIGKFELERDPEQKTVSFTSKMVSATLACGEGQVTFDASLSLMATPFRSKIDEVIDRWLSKNFQ